MSEPIIEHKCGKSGCEVAKTSVCAEGHEPLKACPSYALDIAENLLEVKQEVVDESLENKIIEYSTPLSTGETLSLEELNEFHRWRPISQISIVGDRDSGKTTLINSIYDQFLRGPFAGYIFAGSQTLVAFEKEIHPSRIESGGKRAATAHTSLAEGLKFFHMAAIHKDRLEVRIDLMFSDRAGEMYRRARDDSANVEELSEITHSERVVLLLDGDRVANAIERQGAIQSVRKMLRAFIDSDALGLTSVVQIVTTKIDRLYEHAEEHLIKVQLEKFQQNLINDFAHRLAELSFWEIAARDPDGIFDPAHGVDKLFTDWATPRYKVVPRASLDMTLLSEFDRLLLRTPMKELP